MVPAEVLAVVRGARRVVVMTGAGMSAESGLSTFRDPDLGLWSRFRPEELATPEAWAADPAVVWGWYQWRLGLVQRADPNAGHRALARWADLVELSLITQNVDDLHERAGSRVDHHLHGSIVRPRCADCAEPAVMIAPPVEAIERIEPPRCPACDGLVRPGVVWFGEVPTGIEESARQVLGAELMVVVGTSGVVYPAAGLTDLAVEAEIPTLVIDPAAPDRPGVVAWRTTAGTGLPTLVEAVA